MAGMLPMPGTLTVQLEYGCELRDVQWFGRQDPYCLLTVGHKTMRSRTHNDGGRNPVWNQSFQFSIINENDLCITVKDQEVMADSHIGVGHASLTRVRGTGSDRQQVPIVSRWGRTRGFVQVTLTYQSYGVGHATTAAVPYAAAAPYSPTPYATVPPMASYVSPPYAQPYGPPAAAVPPCPTCHTASPYPGSAYGPPAGYGTPYGAAAPYGMPPRPMLY